jgi:hypothetical protein
MDKKRNLGVTEARFALTLLTCLLVAIGYVALLRLAGPKETTADSGPGEIAPPSIAIPAQPIEPQPIVLPLEKPEDARNEMAERPPSSQQTPKVERR